MSATTAALAGRAAAERLMIDACTITRTSPTPPALNEATGQLVAAAPTPIYAGKCRVKPPPGVNRQVDVGERRVVLAFYTVSVPMSVLGVEVDDIVTITASALDESLVDRTLRVLDVARGSQVSARRLDCQETVA